MVQSTTRSEARVSPSMVESVYNELKANGYSDRQIMALISGLESMARGKLQRRPETVQMESSSWKVSSPEIDLSQLGLPNQTELPWAEMID